MNQLDEIKEQVKKYRSHEVPLWSLYNISFRGDDKDGQAQRWAEDNGFQALVNYDRGTCTFIAPRPVGPK
jgi:hypothetical protein